MLNPTPANRAYYLKNGPVRTDQLTINSFKVYADGALGSRGACLVQPYADRPKETGFLLSTEKQFRELANRAGRLEIPDEHPRHRRLGQPHHPQLSTARR